MPSAWLAALPTASSVSAKAFARRPLLVDSQVGNEACFSHPAVATVWTLRGSHPRRTQWSERSGCHLGWGSPRRRPLRALLPVLLVAMVFPSLLKPTNIATGACAGIPHRT